MTPAPIFEQSRRCCHTGHQTGGGGVAEGCPDAWRPESCPLPPLAEPSGQGGKAHPYCPHPPAFCTAAPAAGEQSNSPYLSAHRSSYQQHSPVVLEGKGNSLSPSSLWKQQAYPVRRSQRQMSEQAGGQAADLSLLSKAAGLPSWPGQLAGDWATISSPSNRRLLLLVGMSGHAPPSGPRPHRVPPVLKPDLYGIAHTTEVHKTVE